MRVRIYQINMERDTENIIFRNYTYATKNGVSPEIYDLKFDGDIPVQTLEGVFALFNLSRPDNFKGHSLSISDIVEFVEGDKSECYYCDDIGWEFIKFDGTKAHKDI